MITLKRSQKQILAFKFWIFSALCLVAVQGGAAIIGQMPAHGDVLYITTEPCTAENGRIEPNWYFSYSVNSLGSVTRSCYVRYNDQIWIKGPYGTESTFPMSYFAKPSASDSGKTEQGSDVKQ
ncbi:hypothetical protein FD975_02490 [Polynucleobacter sp. AP-Jannik-300A-C4]|uniref:hypothetical protein n=1 Tax=Polynucleobacter sp. AP-Jannik-300A-C4 TaxID=2576928 RepID=UPI001BFCFC35|nr:hypothetical protein [Polynucleobacter sp. AP-Jannik-300A-C4]QWE23095.1 hypothetical protein FD975_02490 [Polynucleobacter sp. AP-Jannik-300A-C4]